MRVNDRIFEIPREKSDKFLEQFNSSKISDAFLEECRQSAVKLGRKQAIKPIKELLVLKY